jgi:outer membrane receptor protein involved in Fe transport
MRGAVPKLLIFLSFALGGPVMSAPPAPNALDVPQEIHLPAQPLGEALRELAKLTHLQVLFAPGLAADKVARPVTGVLSPRAALAQLLEGTNLTIEEHGPGVIVLRERAAPSVVARVGSPPSEPKPVVRETTEELDVIVVTAQRREERPQEVPISISAYSQRAMDNRGMRTIEDISRLTPGVSLVHGTNYNSESSNIAIRGIDSNAGAATTGVYIDDTPIHSRHLFFGTFNAYPMLFDLDRVEVLHGPQGTLFGASTEGGAVRFITPEPSLDRLSAYARAETAVTAHGEPTMELGVAGGVPLIAGKIGIRASASYRYEGGYIDRIDWHTGRMADVDSNWSRSQTARLALKWAVNDRVTLTPSIYYQKRDVNDTAAWWVPVAGVPDPTNGQFAQPLRNGNAVANPSSDEFVLPALRIEASLGDLRIVSNTSYFNRNQAAISDYTEYDRAVFLGDPYPAAGEAGRGFWADDQENWTQELRLESTDPAARVSWTAGVFFQRAKENTILNVFDPALVAELGFPVFNGGYIYVQDPFMGIDRQLAIFGQADFKLTPKLDLTLGLRYSKAEFEGVTYYAGPVVGDPVASRGQQSEHPVTPKFGFAYQIDADTLVYASAAKGFRIGGANPAVGQFCYGPGSALEQIGLANVPSTYTSDNVWSYELGTKGGFAQQRLLLNASVYLIRWRNIQQNVPLTECGFQFTANLGEAESKGLDLQLQMHVSDALTLGGTLSYTDAQFTETVQLQPTVNSIVRDGDHLAGSPWKLSVFGQLNFPVRGRTAYLRADYQYNASQADLIPNTNPRNGSYTLFAGTVPAQSFMSLRAGVHLAKWDVSAFAQNLFDTRPRLTVNQDVGSPTGGTPLLYAITWPPRTIGLTATYRY